MEITATAHTVNKSPQEVYDFLSELPNIEQLMPEELELFEMTDEDSFFFLLKGMPKIYLERGACDPPAQIILESSRKKYDFHIAADINGLEGGKSEVIFEFKGDFNMMLEMIIRSPITGLINSMAENLQKLA